MGSVASAQLAAAAIDDESAEQASSVADDQRRVGSEPTGATTTSTRAAAPATTEPSPQGAADDEPEADPGETLAPVDCPPLFEVQFPVGSSVPLTDVGPGPADLADWLADHPDAELVIDGHADALGSEQANLELSFRRAEATAAMIIEAGAAADRVQARGFGEYQPLVGLPPDSDRNRRATMQVPGREECSADDEGAAQ